MSNLIVEVCRVDKIENHPTADKLKIATIKGWQTCVKYEPETNVYQFNEGDLCIYFPPDAVLPKSLYEDRLNIGKYLKSMPKNSDGTPSDFKRVAATRLRGMPSFGVITNIDPSWGDDPNWTAGTNLIDYFGITKYEPPPETTTGDADSPHIRFYAYTSIEHFANYPTSFEENEEVVISEKIHGSNSRVGAVLDKDSSGSPEWIWMAGSHSVRRKEFLKVQTRLKVSDLIDRKFISELPSVDQIIFDNQAKKYWKVEEIIEPPPQSKEQEVKIQVSLVDENGEYKLSRSLYWEPLTENMKSLIDDIKDNYVMGSEKPHSVIVFGEIYGRGTQDMEYGMTTVKGFRAFDICVNGKYLDFDAQLGYFAKHGIEVAPILYRGPFTVQKLQKLTSGPTTMCSAEEAGAFKGREGVVMKPIKEKHYCMILNGRKIVKSVSADYLARNNGTEYH